jgi:hypothetical protein
VHPEDLERTLAIRQRSLKTGERYESEYRLRDRRTGAYHWFLVRALPVHDEAGQITRWFGTSTNIDEKKRLEAALSQSQERMRALIASNILVTSPAYLMRYRTPQCKGNKPTGHFQNTCEAGGGLPVGDTTSEGKGREQHTIGYDFP